MSPLLQFLGERLLHHLLLHPANLALPPHGRLALPLLGLGLVPLMRLAAIDAQEGAPLAEVIVVVALVAVDPPVLGRSQGQSRLVREPDLRQPILRYDVVVRRHSALTRTPVTPLLLVLLFPPAPQPAGLLSRFEYVTVSTRNLTDCAT